MWIRMYFHRDDIKHDYHVLESRTMACNRTFKSALSIHIAKSCGS